MRSSVTKGTPNQFSYKEIRAAQLKTPILTLTSMQISSSDVGRCRTITKSYWQSGTDNEISYKKSSRRLTVSALRHSFALSNYYKSPTKSAITINQGKKVPRGQSCILPLFPEVVELPVFMSLHGECLLQIKSMP